jgi:hypothetical protein
MHSLYTHCTLTMHSLYTHYALTIHSQYTHYALTMHSLCTHYTLTLHSLCTHAILTHSTLTVKEWRVFPMWFILEMCLWQLIFNSSLLVCSDYSLYGKVCAVQYARYSMHSI